MRCSEQVISFPSELFISVSSLQSFLGGQFTDFKGKKERQKEEKKKENIGH